MTNNKLTKLKIFETFNESYIQNNLYILETLSYSTDYEIHNINHASDFWNLIKTTGETKKYVVTKNIDFTGDNKITKYSIFNL